MFHIVSLFTFNCILNLFLRYALVIFFRSFNLSIIFVISLHIPLNVDSYVPKLFKFSIYSNKIRLFCSTNLVFFPFLSRLIKQEDSLLSCAWDILPITSSASAESTTCSWCSPMFIYNFSNTFPLHLIHSSMV